MLTITFYKEDLKFFNTIVCTRHKNRDFLGVLYDTINKDTVFKYFSNDIPKKCSVEACFSKPSRILHLKKTEKDISYILKHTDKKEDVN